MTDVRSPNGGVLMGADLTGNADFVTIRTVAAVETGAYGATNSAKRNLERIMQLVQQVANVKYISVSSAVVDLSNAGNRTANGLGSLFNQAATTVYTIKFIVDQPGFATVANLKALFDGAALPFETAAVPHDTAPVDIDTLEADSATEANISIMIATDL